MLVKFASDFVDFNSHKFEQVPALLMLLRIFPSVMTATTIGTQTASMSHPPASDRFGFNAGFSR
jgi:hypothetical protein